jgi:hypothetical protein
VLLGATDFAVEIGDRAHGLAGVYLFSASPDRCVPRTALFQTREEARDALKACKLEQSWPRARVVRLRVTVEIDEP